MDYLQLMHGTQQTQGNREQEIAQISRSLKGLAKELNVPVIALAQLSRAVETRGGDKRPQLSDLRESGSIEQDADVVMFIYRAERYGITVEALRRGRRGVRRTRPKVLGELLIGKQRNGPIGDVKVAFVNQFARFENLTSYAQPDTDGGYGDPYGQDPFSADPYGGDGSGPAGLPPFDPPPDFGPPGLPPPSSQDPF